MQCCFIFNRTTGKHHDSYSMGRAFGCCQQMECVVPGCGAQWLGFSSTFRSFCHHQTDEISICPSVPLGEEAPLSLLQAEQTKWARLLLPVSPPLVCIETMTPCPVHRPVLPSLLGGLASATTPATCYLLRSGPAGFDQRLGGTCPPSIAVRACQLLSKLGSVVE